MPNPLDFLTRQQIDAIGLSPDELAQVYQPSSGHVTHVRGPEGVSKTLWVARRIKYLIDTRRYSTDELIGNLTFKGKYGYGSHVLKGSDLFQYLWDLTHKPHKHKIVVIDEIDTEFPARFFPDRNQTEIALRMWHVSKLGNMVFMTSHLGNSTDLIFDLASHYKIYPEAPNWQRNSIDFHVIDRLKMQESDWTVYNIIQAMLIYNRQELTEGIGDTLKMPFKKSAKKERQSENQNDVLFDEISSDLPAYI